MNETLHKLYALVSKYKDSDLVRYTLDDLTTQRLELAGHYTSIGEDMAELRREADDLEIDVKRVEMEAYERLRNVEEMSGQDAKMLAKKDTFVISKELNKTRKIVRQYELVHLGTAQVLNALSSRIKVLDREQNTPN